MLFFTHSDNIYLFMAMIAIILAFIGIERTCKAFKITKSDDIYPFIYKNNNKITAHPYITLFYYHRPRETIAVLMLLSLLRVKT